MSEMRKAFSFALFFLISEILLFFWKWNRVEWKNEMKLLKVQKKAPLIAYMTKFAV